MPTSVFQIWYNPYTKVYGVWEIAVAVIHLNEHVQLGANYYSTCVRADNREEALKKGADRISLYIPDTVSNNECETKETPATKTKKEKTKKSHTIASRQLVICKR